MARELFLGCFCDRFIDFQLVIVEELIAGPDIADCIDEDAIIFLDGFAVWVARMIDPARIVAADLWINDFAVFQSEVESVWIVFVIGRIFPGDAFARVFDDARTFGNRAHGINSVTMHTGPANLDFNGSLSSFDFHCRSGGVSRCAPQTAISASLIRKEIFKHKAASAMSVVESLSKARDNDSAFMLRCCSPLDTLQKKEYLRSRHPETAVWVANFRELTESNV